MKTPRELLLNRHAAANAKLDAIRKETIAAECGGETRNSKLEIRSAGAFWRALFWPHPRAWAALAAVWLAIIAIDLSLREPSPPALARRPQAPAPQVLAALKEQKRLLAELLGSAPPAEAVPVGGVAPRPRSEGRIESVVA